MKLHSALDLAAKGFRVFPITPNASKPPAVKDWQNRATTDPTTLNDWWTANPDFNIGIATGQGVLVVDADCKDGRPGLESLDLLDMMGLPESFSVNTPSGGRHVYLASAGAHGNRVDTIPDFPGIDIRAESGYVVGPGSTIGDRGYYAVGKADTMSDSPTWFEDILLDTTHHAPRIEDTTVEPDRPENIERAIAYLVDRAPEAVQGAGGDNTTYSIAAEMRALGISEALTLDLMLEHWNETKASPPWMPDELAVKVANGHRHGQGALGGKTAAGEFSDLGEIDIGESPMRTLIEEAAEKGAEAHQTEKLAARPYHLVDPAAIPKREWLYAKHLMRKFVSVTVAPGGIGKSSLTIVEALAMVSGKALLGCAPMKPLRVWYWNLEDPYDELQRRIQAAIQHYRLDADDIGDRLFVNSGRDNTLRTAIADRNGAKIVRPVVDALTAEMLARRIDAAIIDPFVSSHAVPENDNNGMDMVAKEWGRVADKANASISLVHHTRKMGGDEVTSDSARGGKALIDASRDARVLNRMSKEDGEKAGLDNHRLYFRSYSDKASMAPPADRSDWFKLESVALANGDDVGVVVPWEWPDPFAEITMDHVRRVQDAVRLDLWRSDVRSDNWVGIKVAEIVGLNAKVIADRERLKAMLRDWTEKGWLKVRKVRDEKRQGSTRRRGRKSFARGRFRAVKILLQKCLPPVLQLRAGSGGKWGCYTHHPRTSAVPPTHYSGELWSGGVSAAPNHGLKQLGVKRATEGARTDFFDSLEIWKKVHG